MTDRDVGRSVSGKKNYGKLEEIENLYLSFAVADSRQLLADWH
jgi:hypothetical protein